MSRLHNYKMAHRCGKNVVLFILSVGISLPAFAQYPGRINPNKDKDAKTPELRATAIYEYTGDLAKPTASRLIPLAVWDGQNFQPAGLYLAQPAPLAVLTGTLYELQQAGQPKALFGVKAAQNLSGSWIAIGATEKQKAPQPAKLKPAKNLPQVVKDYDPDKPHFAHRPADDSKDTAQTSGTSKPQSTAPPVDPDRPTLHKRTSSDSGDSTQEDNKPAAQAAPDVDPDRPTLHKHKSTDQTAAASVPVDPDRPVLRHGRPETLETIEPPDSLKGIPDDMEQMAAVSDTKTREPHTFLYSWVNPEDAVKMQSAIEEIAKKAVAPQPSAPAPQKTRTTSARTHRATKPATPALPDLTDEQFKSYELSFGGSATLVFTARTAGEGDGVKYVTIIAKPDLYGTPLILLKQVSSAASLDITPRMRLVDAVDTDADNRAELVFELRSRRDRQFAIYRVTAGQAEQVFTTGPLP